MATKKSTGLKKPAMAVKKKTATAAPKAAKKQPALDSTAEFEKLLKGAANGQHYVLKLFVTGTSLRSSQAIASIRSLCEEHLLGRYDLEVIDIYQQPDEARNEQIIAAPTLVKESPRPPRRMVGDLSDRDKVLMGLNLRSADVAPAKGGKTTWVKL